jgi:UDP-N-acetylmuramoyl-tripeptide--D-alanyl-D-alanine ligase
MTLDLAAIVSATGGTLLETAKAPSSVTVSTDTRSLERGQTFLALRGPSFDGHDFVAEAIARGAALIVIDRAEAAIEGTAALVVRDTLQAYLAMARLARERFDGPIVAITGSTGKTTTRAFVVHLLQPHYGSRIASAPGNENNEIGVAKLLLQMDSTEHDLAVVEMGARHPGDIATLVDVATPDIGILTNVGDAHLEIMGSRETLAETKWALFSRGARAILNARDDVSLARARSLLQPVHWFDASSSADALRNEGRLTAIRDAARLIDCEGDRVLADVPAAIDVPGAHNRTNAAAAAACALELGVDANAVAGALSDLQMPSGRFETFEMQGGWRIIYDAYNASASGTIAALDALDDQHPRRAIAVLGSMAELGAESTQLHERVGAHAARRAGVVVVSGEYADALIRGARRGGDAEIVRVDSNVDAARWLRDHARSGDVVLLKGSRKYRLEEILVELRS